MRYVYTQADTMQKRELVSMVFDNNLYCQEGIYRTPTMMDMFTHNSLLMSEKGYLIYEKKGMILQSSLTAEREGFEPPVPVTVHLISNQAHSTALTSLQNGQQKYNVITLKTNRLHR